MKYLLVFKKSKKFEIGKTPEKISGGESKEQEAHSIALESENKVFERDGEECDKSTGRG